MANEYQVTWEYSDGNTITFKTNDLEIDYRFPGYREDIAVDGTVIVTDPGVAKYTFTFTAILIGDDMDAFDAVLRGAITHTGAYPRITKIYWDGDSTETNIEVGRPMTKTIDRSAGYWLLKITLRQKDQ